MSDLRQYIREIEKAGALHRIKKPISARYQIAGITAEHDGSSAVMFERVRGTKFRVVTNLVGTRERFAQAVGAKKGGIHGKVIAASRRPKRPRTVPRAKFMQNSSKSASALPIVTHFAGESGPFITSSIVYAKNPETGRQNSSFHRMMPVGKGHLTIRMVEGRHLHRCYVDAKEHGQDLEVAVTIGVHPAVSIAGAYQAEWGQDEMAIANSLLGGRMSVARCPNSQLLVPSGAEIVLEGRILQDRLHPEWMVEMLRTHDHPRRQPLLEVDRAYYRDDPIYHDILSGYGEHRLLMGMPAEAKLSGQLQKEFAGASRAALTQGGCNWLHAVVQMKRRPAPGEPKRIIRRAFAINRSLKQVTVVDSDIDPESAEQVEFAAATRFQADRDLIILRNRRGSSLDPSSNQRTLMTAKTGIDATIPRSKRPAGFEQARIPKGRAAAK